MKRHGYTTTEVASISGFSARQLDHWARLGIVVPSLQEAHGSGSRRLYAFEDLIHLGFIRHLKSHGWSMQKIRQAVVILREVIDDARPLRNAVLVNGRGTLLALSKTKKGEAILLDALSTGGQQVMPIVLEVLEAETRNLLSLFVGQLPNQTGNSPLTTFSSKRQAETSAAGPDNTDLAATSRPLSPYA